MAIALRRLKLPYTVGLVIVGLGLGYLSEVTQALEPLRGIELSPEIILFVFLPTLIFESAFNMDSRLLAKNLTPVVALAAPGLLLSTVIVGGLVSWLTPLPLGYALLFGALISATDPVAVIALFKELGAPKRLAILVEGESLFNDATAIVLFGIIVAVLDGGVFEAATLTQGVIDFIRVFVGGLLVGSAIGYLMIRSIALADDDPLVEVALSTVVAYAAFIAADHYLKVSGVMATVGAGVVIGTFGSTRFSAQVREYLHQFWEYAAFVANSLIFLLVGMSVSLTGLFEHGTPIIWAIVAAMIARAVIVFGLVPVIGRLPGAERIDLRYQTVMFSGGLRGAVALALALSLAPEFPFRDLIIALAVGVVLFTLLTGGLALGPLMNALGLSRPSLAERVAKVVATVAAKRSALDRVAEMATAGHYSGRLLGEVEKDYLAEVAEAELDLVSLQDLCHADEMKTVLWSQALTVERTVFRRLFDRGVISEPVLRELEIAVDLQRDDVMRGNLTHEIPAAAPLEVRFTETVVGIVERVFPKMGFVQRHRLKSLAARYEYDSAILDASHHVTAELERLVELSGADEALAADCRAEWERRGREAMARLDSVAEYFPEYVRAVQSRTVRRIVLDGEVDAVEELASAGGIPASVAREARGNVDTARKKLAKQPVSALAPRPEELLARVPMFADLSPEDHQRVVDALVLHTVLAGRTIIRQGQKGTSLFLVARGVVAVLIAEDGAQPKRVASLHAGDFFGEMALLTEEPRTATVTAVSDCQLYELAKRDVDAICETSRGVKDALVAAYRKRTSREQEEVSARRSRLSTAIQQ